jgi:tRNA U55 pseudouridine synthase TruB
MFQTRMAEAEKSYYKMMGITPPNSTCSKGTYIRSLCADLGKALGRFAQLYLFAFSSYVCKLHK